MAVSERTLRKWRKQALQPLDKTFYDFYDTTEAEYIAVAYKDYKERILILTQELLDQHLLKGRRIRNDKGGIN